MGRNVVITHSTDETDDGDAAVLTPLTEPLRYGIHTGVEVDSALQQTIPAAAVLGLEPPRFCGQCGRRMVVQVLPDGWTARCSRHGHVDAGSLGRR